MLGNQFARAALGDLAAVVQHQQALAQALGLVHEVRGQQDRLALAQQALQALPHQVARLRIEAGGRLVKQQQIGVVHQRTRQRQAALHAARQLGRLGARLVAERGEVQQLRHPLGHLRAAQAEVAAEHVQVLGAAEVRVERIELRYHAEACLDGQAIARHLQRRAVGPREVADAADIRRRQPQAHADGGGLARAVGADHAQAFARRDAERHAIHHARIAIGLGEITHIEQRRGSGHEAAIVPARRADGGVYMTGIQTLNC